MTNPDLVLYSEEGGIAWLTLNRPEALNALSGEVLSALSTALGRAADDPPVQAAVLTGAGEKAFSAGADIAYMSTAAPAAVRDLARAAVAVTTRRTT